MLEESGLEIEVGEIIGLYTYDGQIPAIAVFAAEVTGGEPTPLDETMAVRSFRETASPGPRWPSRAPNKLFKITCERSTALLTRAE